MNFRGEVDQLRCEVLERQGICASMFRFRDTARLTYAEANELLDPVTPRVTSDSAMRSAMDSVL
jgi:hypothetical protein